MAIYEIRTFSLDSQITFSLDSQQTFVYKSFCSCFTIFKVQVIDLQEESTTTFLSFDNQG